MSRTRSRCGPWWQAGTGSSDPNALHGARGGQGVNSSEPARDDIGRVDRPDIADAGARYFDSSPRPIERALLVAAFALLTFLRFPSASLNGRFWAEEGSVFYAHTWTSPFAEALLFSYGGYLNFVANTSALLAYFAPIE